MVSRDAAEVHRSTADLAVLAAPAAVCARARAGRSGPCERLRPGPFPVPRLRSRLRAGEPLRAAHVFSALAERLPRDAIVIEESPSNRPELLVRLPARESLGSLSPAMGGLGFALPAATGLRLARPDRPVVAIVGDGSSLYSIQALWSAAHYRAGVLFVILANGGYAIMDRLAEQAGRHARRGRASRSTSRASPGRSGAPPGPLRARRAAGVLDEVCRAWCVATSRSSLEVAVAPDETFAP